LGCILALRDCARQNCLNSQCPDLVFFQISGADTISQLLRLNTEITETDLRLPVNPFEPTLQSTNPMSTYGYVRDIVLKTGSFVQTVEHYEVEAHAEVLEEECHNLSIPLSYEQEKCPFISWAGLVRLSQKGMLNPDEEISFIITGSAKAAGDILTPDKIITPDSPYLD